MNKLVYTYLGIVILCWTLSPFIKKKMLYKLTNDEYFIINHIFITIIIAGYFLYYKQTIDCDINCLKKLNVYDYIYIIMGSIASFLGAKLILHLFKFKDVSYVVAHIQPIIIGLTFIIGYLFFKEKITIYKILGCAFIILGIVFLNKKHL